jgi:putative transposase
MLSETLYARQLRAELQAAAVGSSSHEWLLGTAVRAGLVSEDGVVASEPTLRRALRQAREGGRNALLPGHTGRVRQDYGWEIRALAMWQAPSKPTAAGVARKLRHEGHDTATESRVLRFFKSMPETLGKNSPHRIGKHLHKLRRQKFQRRSLAEVLVGEIYAGDGHTVDVYVAHPNTGGLFRAELTVFIDIKSRYIVGWYVSESETKESTLYALASAMVNYDHVPAWLYVDRGAGYRAQMLSDENTGYYARFDIDTIAALPGNPHGKGWIERFFKTCRDDHDKLFEGGMFYCGDDMAPEINRRLHVEIKNGKRVLPSLDDYVASFARFIDEYHNEPKDVLGGRTPAQVWAELSQIKLYMAADAVLRPVVQRTVTRQTVRFHKREYYHELLAQYDGRSMRIEYDLHNDKTVWIFDDKGRQVCEATLTNTIGVLPSSRQEEQRQRRLAGQVKRLERHTEEARRRLEDPITHETQIRALEDLGAFDQADVIEGFARPVLDQVTEPVSPPQIPRAPRTPKQPAARAVPHDDDEIHIDITDWSAD